MPEALEKLCVDTVRALSMDAIQKANSGHPGLPMGMAPTAFVLFADVMRHDPTDPAWKDRDRFILSAGHGSMLHYAALHLSGYDLSMDDLKAFRQWGSRTPGHPEREIRDTKPLTPGIEVTTGPLGQGFANGVGMALAEKFLRERFGTEVQDHRVYAICSDGDLQEGIASEAASLAGHLGLGRMVYLYDDNSISLDGPTSLSWSEDVEKRFDAYGWQVLRVDDAEDLDAIRAAIESGRAEEERPTLIHVKSVIGYPSPNKQGTSGAHGAPLGDDEIRLTKEAMGLDPDLSFHVPDGVLERFGAAGRAGAEAKAEWESRLATWRDGDASRAADWDTAWTGRPSGSLADVLPRDAAAFGGKDALATRSAGKTVMAAFAPLTPTFMGGAADLTSSTNTILPGGDDERFTKEHAGRNVFFGIREHAMGAAVNGMAAHGGIIRPYGSTFLQFADYMRGAIRLSALQHLDVAWVFTHDSVAVGEDGPTHQPVEHIAALRAIPGLTVLRPADATEVSEAWRVVLEDVSGPAAIILSRQNLPVLDREVLGPARGLARGAYVLREPEGDEVAAVVATGSEVHVALEAADRLAAEGVHVRVVSMPSWELFDAQDADTQDETLPPDLPTVSIEAGITMGWDRFADVPIGIDRFGASAPGAEVLDKLGINAGAVVEAVKELLED